MKYPRAYITEAQVKRIAKAAKKKKATLKKIGQEVVAAGLKVLGY